MEDIVFKTASVLPQDKAKPEIKPVEFSLCDKNAHSNAKKLAAYLKGVSSDGYLIYGHQNDVHMKAGPRAKGFTSSDSADITGEYAGLTGIDSLCLVGTENGRFYWKRSKRIKACVDLAMKSVKYGAIVSMSAHMPNFQLLWEWKNGITPKKELYHPEDKKKDKLINGPYSEWPTELSDGATNFYGYFPNDLRGTVVKDVIEGGKLNSLFTEYLDLVCDWALALDKKNVAVIWRPFHENSGSWFWWGEKFCSPEEFKALWQYTFRYFTEKRNVHNLIWAYSPGSEYHSVEEYESRYPGDEYVDLVGFDMYQQQGDAFWGLYEEQCSMISQMAKKHSKLFANTETGVITPGNKALLNNGNPELDWYQKVADICLKYGACYYLLWANFNARGAYWIPYIQSYKKSKGKIIELNGHEMLDGFVRFYNNQRVLFSREIEI